MFAPYTFTAFNNQLYGVIKNGNVFSSSNGGKSWGVSGKLGSAFSGLFGIYWGESLVLNNKIYVYMPDKMLVFTSSDGVNWIKNKLNIGNYPTKEFVLCPKVINGAIYTVYTNSLKENTSYEGHVLKSDDGINFSYHSQLPHNVGGARLIPLNNGSLVAAIGGRTTISGWSISCQDIFISNGNLKQWNFVYRSKDCEWGFEQVYDNLLICSHGFYKILGVKNIPAYNIKAYVFNANYYISEYENNAYINEWKNSMRAMNEVVEGFKEGVDTFSSMTEEVLETVRKNDAETKKIVDDYNKDTKKTEEEYKKQKAEENKKSDKNSSNSSGKSDSNASGSKDSSNLSIAETWVFQNNPNGKWIFYSNGRIKAVENNVELGGVFNINGSKLFIKWDNGKTFESNFKSSSDKVITSNDKGVEVVFNKSGTGITGTSNNIDGYKGSENNKIKSENATKKNEFRYNKSNDLNEDNGKGIISITDLVDSENKLVIAKAEFKYEFDTFMQEETHLGHFRWSGSTGKDRIYTLEIRAKVFIESYFTGYYFYFSPSISSNENEWSPDVKASRWWNEVFKNDTGAFMSEAETKKIFKQGFRLKDLEFVNINGKKRL